MVLDDETLQCSSRSKTATEQAMEEITFEDTGQYIRRARLIQSAPRECSWMGQSS